MSSLDEAWAEFNDYYCKHGYYRGVDCPDCDVPSHLPAYLTNCDPGDETDYEG